MKKSAAILLTLALLAGTFTGCGGGSKSDAPQESKESTPANSTPASKTDSTGSGEEIIINVYDWDGQYDTSIIDRFNEQNPGIKAVFNTVPDNNDKVTKLDILAMGGGDIDVMPMADGDQFMRMQNGMLAPLDEFIAADGVDMEANFGAYAEWAKSDGTYYSVPLRVNLQGIFYNKDMFDAAGLPYPDDNWTVEEYVETARKLTKGSGADKIYGTYTHTWSGEWNSIGAQKGTYYTADGACNFDNEAFRTSLSLRKSMDDEGIQQSFDQIMAVKAMPNSAFLGEQCAMVQCGAWLIRDMKSKDRFPFDFNVGWTYMPRIDDTVGNKCMNTSVSVLGIPATSKNPEAAWKFIRFYIEENSDTIAASGNIPAYLPAYTDDMINIFIEGSGFDIEYAKKLFATDTTVTSNKVGVPPDTYASGPQYNQVMNEEVQLYFNGEQDLDTTVSNVVAKASEVIGK